MIENFISISTLMICTFASTMVVGIFMLQVWLTDRRHKAAGYWCVAMWVGSLCSLLFAFRPIGNPLLTIGLANALGAFAYGLMWTGFRVFDHRRPSLPAMLVGATVWTAAYLLIPAVAQDVNMRIVVTSSIITAYSLAIARQIWRGRDEEKLPTRTLSAIFFLSHAAIYALRIPLAIAFPAQLSAGTANSPWFALFSLELFAHTILAAIAMLVLIKERGEALYRKASRIDALTGVANRGFFLEQVQARLGAAAQGTLMIFDLDRFKAINDTHGHLAGDMVLKRFSGRVSEMLGENMLFCRLGGEEFALFAPEHDIAQAEAFAETLRRETAALRFYSATGRIEVSVSIGLADVATFGRDFDRLHSAADGALYVAKTAGRDRVVRACPANELSDLARRMRRTAPLAERNAQNG